MDDGFEELLARIREKEHPEFGTLEWDGETRQVTYTVKFDGNGNDSDEVIRSRAARFLEQLSPEERKTLNIAVDLRAGRPVMAVLRGSTGQLKPERLRQMELRARLKQ